MRITGQGLYTVAASGTVTFDPDPTFVGTGTPVTYRIADAAGATATSTITITTTAVTPRANPEARFTPFDTTIAVDVVANDTAGDASSPLVPGTLSLFNPADSTFGTSLTVAGQGTYTATTTGTGAGTVTFDPLPSFSGAASPVTYRVADDNGTTTTSTLSITVGTPPSAVPDSGTTQQDINLTIRPLTNDTASQNGTPTPSSVTLLDPATSTYRTTVTIAGQGTYTADAAGAVLFDPVPTFTGSATPITYRASDSNGATLQSTIGITVTPITPTAVSDSRSTAFDTAVGIPVLENDRAGDPSAPLVAGSVQLLDPATGTYRTSVTTTQGSYAVNTTTGAVTFTPATGFRGTTTPLTYRLNDDNQTTATATITVSVDQPAPPSANPDTRTTPQGVPVTLSPSANDSPGPTGAALLAGSVRLFDPATNSYVESLTVAGEGTYSVDTTTGPGAGTVRFTPVRTYTGSATSVGYRVTDANGATATSSITVTVTTVTPRAADDTSTTPYETAVRIAPLSNDGPGDAGVPLVPSSVRIFDPVAGAFATTVSVPGQGTYVVDTGTGPSAGTVTFTPATGFRGLTTALTYRVADANETTTTARITVTVALPPAPRAEPDTATTPQNVTVELRPLANDRTGAASVAFQPGTLVLLDPASDTYAGSLTVAGQGVYTADATGVVTFDPEPGYRGTASPVTYRVTDGSGQSATSTLTVTVTPITPTASDDVANTPATTAVTTQVLANDAPGADSARLVGSSVVLTAAAATNGGKRLAVAGQGVYTVDLSTGALTFVPEPTFTGPASPVTYRVADANGTTATATYTVTVGALPVARPDVATTPQNIEVTLDPVANDTPGTDGAGGSATLIRSSVVFTDGAADDEGKRLAVAGQGVYTIDRVTGEVTFDPDPAFRGQATTVVYRVTGTYGTSATSTITITVRPLDPRAVDDSRATPYDTTIEVPVLGNDTAAADSARLVPSSVRLIDPATGDPVASLAVAAQGVYTATADGTVVFDPAPGFSGAATPQTYRVLDTNGTQATAQVRITVGAAPIARPDTRTTPQGVEVVISPLADDTPGTDGTDGAGNPGTFETGSVVLTNPAAVGGKTLVVDGQGTYAVEADGTVRFVPVARFTGTATGVEYAVTDSFGNRATSTITVAVTPITPSAADDRATTPQDTDVSLDVLANDTPGAGSALLQPGSVVLTDPGAAPGGKSLVVAGQGTYTVNADGTVGFDPVPGFAGQTTVVGYRVADRNGTTATATIAVTVGAPAIARPDSATTPQNIPTTVSVLENDTPGTDGAGGSGTLTAASVVLTGPGASADRRTQVVADQGTFQVNPNGSVTFTPLAAFTGTTTAVPYQVTDSFGGTATSTISVIVTPVTPRADDDTARTPAATPVTLSVLANDTPGSPAAPLVPGSVVLTDPAATAAGKSLVTAQGTWQVNGGGTVTFTPAAGFAGVTDRVQYTVADTNGTTDPAVMSVTVGDAPTANPDATTTPQDVTVTLDPLLNDTPGTDATLVRTSVVFTNPGAQPGGKTLAVAGEGTFTIAASGEITFDPLPTFVGRATRTYSVRDTNGNTAVSTASFTVTAITPSAADDVRNTPSDTTITVPVLANDSAGAPSARLEEGSVVLTSVDAEDAGRTLVVAGQGTYTVTTAGPDAGSITFDPQPDFAGPATPVAYRVLDRNGTAATASLRITVGAGPQARPDAASTPQNVTVQLSPLDNDTAGSDGAGTTGTLRPGSVILTDPGASADGTSLVVAGQGTWRVEVSGRVLFDPESAFTGTTDPVTYRVTDSYEGRATSTLSVTVTPITPSVNDDAVATPANTRVTIAVLGNDRPGAASAALVTGSVLLTSPQATNGGKTLLVDGQGTWQVNGDGSLTCTPAPGTTGVTTPPLEYSVADTNGTRGTGLVSVSVGEGPTAGPDAATTPQNVTVTVPTVENDEPGTGATLVPGSVVLPSPDAEDAGRRLVVPGEGTYTVSATTGAITFDPEPAFRGTSTVTYAVRDTDQNAAASTVTITVTPVTPTAEDDVATTPSGTTVRLDVLANDDPGTDGPALVPASVVLTSADAANGGTTLVVAGQGTYTVATTGPGAGSIAFDPVPGFTGPATPVGYRVLDGNGTPAEASVRITVGAGPIAAADTAATPQNVTVTVDVLGNDRAGTDGAGTTGTLVPGSVVLTSPAAEDAGTRLVVAGQGTYVVATSGPGAGTIAFDPEPGFTGPATPVAYRVTDSFGTTASSTLTVTVTPLTPTVNDDTAAGPAGVALVVDVLANDRPGADSAQLVAASVVLTSPAATDGGTTLVVPGQGTWQVNADGTITFTPAPGFSGVTTPPVEYQVSDTNGTSGRASITLTIGAGPDADPDAATTPQDVETTIDVLENDEPGEGLSLDRTSVRFADSVGTADERTLVVDGEGTWRVSTTGIVTFDPIGSFTGQASTTYLVRDSGGNSAAETVTVTVTPIRPEARDDAVTTPTDRTVGVRVRANDLAGDATAPLIEASVRLTSPDATGGGTSLVVAGQGTYTVTTTGPDAGVITFDPVPGFAGAATPVTYRIADDNGTLDTATLSVTVLTAPTAAADDRTTPQNVTIAVDALDNDTAGGGGATLVPGSLVLSGPGAAPDGKSLELAGVGVLRVDAGGVVSFDPEPAFTGTTPAVAYQVTDSAGSTASSTITVRVTPVVPDAVDDDASTPYDTTTTMRVLDNDVAGAPATLVPASLRLIDPATGGPVSSVTVAGQGTWTADADGRVTCDPAVGFAGPTTPLTYRITDDNGTSDTAVLRITVDLPAGPRAARDERTTPQDLTVTLDPLANDTATSGVTLDPASVLLTSPAADPGGRRLALAGIGVLTVDASTGEVTFDPAPTYTGTTPDVGYSVADQFGQRTDSVLSLTVTPITPVVNDDTAATPANRPVTLVVLANDRPGDPSTVLVRTSVRLTGPGVADAGRTLQTAQGSYVVDPDSGSVTFTPAAGFAGVTTPVSYEVTDDNGTTGTARISVTVGDGPAAAPDAATTEQNVDVLLDVVANDRAGEGGTLERTSVLLTSPDAAPGGKSLVVAGQGTWRVDPSTGAVVLDPEPGFVGTASTTYSVADSFGNRAVATLTVTVSAVTPVAADDTAATPATTPVDVEVLQNDVRGSLTAPLDEASVVLTAPGASPDGKGLVVLGVGSYAVDGDGTVSFTPAPGFEGVTPPVPYRVTDTNGTTTTARLTVTVGAAPAPVADSADTLQDVPVTVAVLANDAPGAGARLVPASVVLTSQDATDAGTTLVVPGVGTWRVDRGTGSVTLDPEPGYTGTTTTTYAVSDTDDNTGVATVTVRVDPVTPVAGDDTAATPANRPVGVAVLTNDAPGDPSSRLVASSVVLTSPLAGDGGKTLVLDGVGTFRVGAQGGIVFTPEPGFAGLAGPVTYQVSDDNGTTATAQLTVTVGAAPTARPDEAGTAQDEDVTLDPLVNDAPGTGATLRRESVELFDPATSTWTTTVELPGEGTVSVAADGRITFDPLPGFTGTTGVTYRVADTDDNLAAATVTLRVSPVTPRAVDDDASTPSAVPVSIDVLANDVAGAPSAPLEPTSVRLTGPGVAQDGRTLEVPGEGTWTVSATTGAVTFSPQAGFSGSTTAVRYVVLDGNGTPAGASVRVSVGAAALARPDSATTPQNVTVRLDPLTNDAAGADGAGTTGTLDPTSVVIAGAEGDGRTLVVAGQGTWRVDPAGGQVSFDPLPGFVGTTTAVAYEVTDSFGTVASSTLRVVVTAITPTAANDTGATSSGDPVTLDVLANDAPGAPSARLDPASVVLTDPAATDAGRTLLVPGEGTWSVDATSGALTFTPLPAFDGITTPVQYRVLDTNGSSATALAQVTVGEAPVAGADGVETAQNTEVTLDPLVNDRPGAGATLLATSVRLTDPAAAADDRTLVVAGQGTWTVSPSTGAVTFDPVPAFTGRATTTYSVTDSNGDTGLATITVTVTALVPVANPDTGNARGGRPVVVDVLANDRPAAPSALLDPRSVVLSDPAATDGGTTLVVPGEGTWTVNPDTGAIRFEPVDTFAGPASPVTYRVSDTNGSSASSTVSVVVGERPSARPDLVSVDQGTTARVDPLANDIGGTDGAGGRAVLDPTSVRFLDPDAEPGAKTLVVPGQGTWRIDPATGEVTFEPLARFTGEAVTPYAVTGSFGATATSTITVRVVPLTPTINDDTAASPAGAPVRVAVLANDRPGSSAAPLVPSSLRLTSPDATGDGTLLVVPGQGTWQVEDGTIVFTPEPGFTGVTTPPVQYQVADRNGTTGTGLVSVTVGEAPTATPDAARTPQGVDVSLDPLANDAPGTGATLDRTSVVLTTPGTSDGGRTLVVDGVGTWTVSPTTGRVTFEPDQRFSGQTSVTYQVTDSDGNAAVATIVVSVDPITPTAVDDSAFTRSGTAVVVPVLDNDRAGATTAPLDRTSVVFTSPAATNGGRVLVVPREGTFAVAADGTVRFSPVSGFAGPTTPVTYQVADENGTTTTAQLTVTVGAGPTAQRDTASTAQAVAVTTDVLANDEPSEGGATLLPGSVVLTSPNATSEGRTLVVAGVGTWTVLPDGQVRLTPEPGFTGTASTTYAVSDTTGGTAVATLTVTVTAITPDADDDTATTPSGTPVSVDVLANDDPGAPGVALQPGSVVLVSPAASEDGKALVVPGQGTWRVGPEGRITFTPEAGFTGLTAPVTYAVSDANGTTATATVTVAVGAAPRAMRDEASTPQDVTVSIDVLANDAADAPAVLVRDTLLLLDPATGAYAGSVTIDGEGTWSVDPATGDVRFDPLPGFVGDASVTYQVADSNGNVAVSTVRVSVIDAGDPQAQDDVVTATSGGPVTVDVLANDAPASDALPLDPASVRLVDPGTGALTRTLVVPGEGTWTVNPDGTLTFTPEPGFSGPATPVTYSVADEAGTAVTATVSVRVPSPAVIAGPDTATAPYGAPVRIDVLANDAATGPAGALDPASVRLVDPVTGALVRTLVVPGEGTWTVDDEGGLTFTPEPGFSGPATPVTYSVADTAGLAATSTVALVVGDPPTPDPTPTPTPTPTLDPTPTPAPTPAPTAAPTTTPDVEVQQPVQQPVQEPVEEVGSDGDGEVDDQAADSAPTDDGIGGILPNTGGPALMVLGLGLSLLLAGAWVLGRRRRS